MNIREFFKLGLDRNIPKLAEVNGAGKIVNLGSGKKEVEKAIDLDYPEWKAGNPIPLLDGSVKEVHAYHFFEHLTTKEIIETLREVERILKVGGVVYILVPHSSCTMAFNDIDHKSYFNEEVWPKLLNNSPYYEQYGEWKLKVHANFIMGIVERNLGLFTQLIKEG